MSAIAEPPGAPLTQFTQNASEKSKREAEAYADTALTEAKQSGLLLAVRARWIAMGVIAIMLPIVNPQWAVLYYHMYLVLFALIGWAQLKVGTVGQSRAELFLLFCDLALMTMITVVPNPFDKFDWPTAMQFRYNAFIFFFVLLATGTLHYSWRTFFAFGTWTTLLWILGIALVYFFPNAQPQWSEEIYAIFAPDTDIAHMLDPNAIDFGLRFQELVAFLLVVGTLALAVRRAGDLLRSHAAVERERTNLARYFSPNVVEELSQNDDPLKQVRTQNVAVLFVDIVGFTQLSDGQNPEEVIRMLREFHGRMEREVFRHGGTLDKYLGDGLMATFGTPIAGEEDAFNALRCAQSMMKSLEEFNRNRHSYGQPEIRAGFGLHYGPVVLGDIGANRLEFAVIGTTVNAASRLEALTRNLNCNLIASDDLVCKAKSERNGHGDGHEFEDLELHPDQAIRGLERPISVWSQGARN